MYQTAQVNYHVKTSSPQAFYFDIDGVAGDIVTPELVPTVVQVRDIRGNMKPVKGKICREISKDYRAAGLSERAAP